MALYLVSTPIGNLADITLRALETLRNCHMILCEDTRHSKKLLAHHGIERPLKSYHQFNEAAREQPLIQELRAGREIALISDAGTPAIADPGTRLVQACIREDIPVIPIPGPCALIAALTLSGLDTAHFQFIGFLPRKSSERRQRLLNLLDYPGTTICYESPHRLVDVLEELAQLAPMREIAIARELTKAFEEVQRGTSSRLYERWKNETIRGECVLLVAGQPDSLKAPEKWKGLSPKEHVQIAEQHYGLSKKEAIKLVAELRGLPKRDVYQQLIHDEGDPTLP